MHVALSLGTIPSFVVRHIAKLVIGSGDKAMNPAVLCGDFQTIFFLLLVSRSLEKKTKKTTTVGWFLIASIY